VGRRHVIWRGDVYDVDLGHPVGREPAFTRPAVVTSTDLVNNGPGEILIVVPVGTTGYGLRSHIELDPGPTGLDRPSYARCDQIRTISTRRIVRRRGQVDTERMHLIDRALRFLLEL
jgi:mRNA interferase MazF